MPKKKTSFGSIEGNNIVIEDVGEFTTALNQATERFKKGSKGNPLSLKDQDELNEAPYIIKEATLKDGYCNYVFEITKGTGFGDKHKVDGSGLIEDDLRYSFGRFNVHMAAIDDVFKHSDVEIDDINNFHGHEHAHLYNTTGFKISGGKDDESVILIGTKYVSCAGGRIEIKTPKIPLDNNSSYPWFQQLREAVDRAREEVALYKEGKYTVEEDEDEENPVQMTIDQNIEPVDDGEGEQDDDFQEN
jgi:hypothetical protein